MKSAMVAAAAAARPAAGAQPEALYGHGPDWGYFQFGAVWYGDELWNQGANKDYNGDGQFGDWEKQRWCSENGYENCFLPWTKVTHPTLGEVEVGGINPEFMSQNPPAAALEPWLHNETAFNLYQTQSLPQVSIVKTKVVPLTGDPDGATHQINVTVENLGRIPTALEQAKQVKIVRPDTVQVTLPEGSGTVVGAAPSFFLKGNQRTTVAVKVKLGATPPASVTVKASSTAAASTAARWPGRRPRASSSDVWKAAARAAAFCAVRQLELPHEPFEVLGGLGEQPGGGRDLLRGRRSSPASRPTPPRRTRTTAPRPRRPRRCPSRRAARPRRSARSRW